MEFGGHLLVVPSWFCRLLVYAVVCFIIPACYREGGENPLVLSVRKRWWLSWLQCGDQGRTLGRGGRGPEQLTHFLWPHGSYLAAGTFWFLAYCTYCLPPTPASQG